MKTFKTFFAVLTLVILEISCSSDDQAKPITYEEENPLDVYMSLSGFNQKTRIVKDASVFSEAGFKFKPAVTGKINSFIVKIPDTNSGLRVTLWDAETKTILRSETINVQTENVSVEKTIVPIALIKDHEYIISLLSGDWFSREKAEGLAATNYPIVAGNITITGFGHISTKGTEYLFPATFRDTFYFGDATFKFQQTE